MSSYRPSFERLFLDYLKHREGQSETTLEACRHWLNVFADCCRDQGLDSPLGVAPRHLEEFRLRLTWTVSARTRRFYSPNTIDQALRMVRSWLRWAFARGWLELDPTRDLVLGRPPQPPQQVLTRDQVQALLAAPDPKTPLGLRDRALLALLYHTPLSVGQAAALDLVHVKLPNWLRPDGPRLDLDGELAARLKRYLDQARPQLASRPTEQALFLSSKGGGRLGVPAMIVVLRRAAQAAGLTSVSPRTLRRSAAAHLDEFQQRRLGPRR